MPRKTETKSVPEVSEKDKKDAVTAEAKAVENEVAVADQDEAKAEEPKEKKKPGRKPGRKPGTSNKKTEKAEKAELVPEVFVEYQGQSATEASVIDKVKAAYVANGHRASSIKSLQVYMKPEDFKAYYVINGKLSGEVTLF